MPKKNEQIFTSNNQAWRTPNSLWNNLNKRYNFWLDLAADEFNAKCNMYFDEKMDALKQNWYDIQKLYEPETIGKYSWCNPPYSGMVEKFLKKANYENDLGFRSVFLVAARMETKRVQHFVINKAAEVYFIEKRITFEDEFGVPATAGATFPSMLCIYDGNIHTETKFGRMDIYGNIL